jgi:hypothetical protein
MTTREAAIEEAARIFAEWLQETSAVTTSEAA